MTNLILMLDEKTLDRARVAARVMGLDLDQYLRNQIERLAGFNQRASAHDEYEARARASKGQLNGWRPNRDDANARAVG